jgi:uncharacterized protein (DUF305 family)
MTLKTLGALLLLTEVSSARPFAELMREAGRQMHQGMANAERTGDPDFASEMIPHHQGAIEMARLELLYGRNPVLRRMAQEIIVTQQQEIGSISRISSPIPSRSSIRRRQVAK